MIIILYTNALLKYKKIKFIIFFLYLFLENIFFLNKKSKYLFTCI